MATPNRFKELLEKLKEHAEANNDKELKDIVASFEPSGDEEDTGGNHPTDPPQKP